MVGGGHVPLVVVGRLLSKEVDEGNHQSTTSWRPLSRTTYYRKGPLDLLYKNRSRRSHLGVVKKTVSHSVLVRKKIVPDPESGRLE